MSSPKMSHFAYLIFCFNLFFCINYVFACEEGSYKYSKYIVESSIKRSLNQECNDIHIIFQKRIKDSFMSVSKIHLNIKDEKGMVVARLSPEVDEPVKGYMTAYICLSEKYLRNSELDVIATSDNGIVKLDKSGFKIYGPTACFESETIMVNSLNAESGKVEVVRASGA